MMNKTRTGYAVGSLLQDDMAMMEEDMPIEETHMMPDGTEMPGATHEVEEDMLQRSSGSRRRNGKRIFRFYT
jgi:hypothetical protein